MSTPYVPIFPSPSEDLNSFNYFKFPPKSLERFELEIKLEGYELSKCRMKYVYE